MNMSPRWGWHDFYDDLFYKHFNPNGFRQLPFKAFNGFAQHCFAFIEKDEGSI